MSKRTCILDFETTGVDPKTCLPLELGYRLYENELSKPFKPHLEHAELINHPNLTEIDPRVTEVNGITLDMIRKKGSDLEACVQRFLNATQNIDYFIAYNISFDAIVMARAFQQFITNCAGKNAKIVHPVLSMDNWICGMEDVPYPKKYRCKIMSHLAFDHGVLPDKPIHRAMGDVALLEKLLNKGEYTLEKILTYKNTPWVYLKALVSPPWEDQGKSTSEAKKAGFSYETAKGTDAPRFEKTWVRRIKETELADEKKIELPFKRILIRT